MKKLLAILVMGIGIVLTIPNSTFAVDSCDFNTVDGNAITGTLTAQHICVANDVMDITTGTITVSTQPIKATVDSFTLTVGSAGIIRASNSADGDEGIAINSTGDNAIINNSGTIEAIDGTDYGIKGYGDTLNLTNSGTIQAAKYGLHVTGASSIITNSGEIYGTTLRAISLKGAGHTITNESEGTIQGGASSWDLNDKLAVELKSSAVNLILNNYGTINSGINTVKTESTGMILTNYSGGTISAQTGGSTYKAIFVDGNDNIIKNYGTISAAGDTDSIKVSSGVTGTKIYVDGAPTFTGEVELTNSTVAANTTMYLGCSMTQDTTIEIHNHGGALNIENNLCGNDTYTLSTEVLDDSDSDDGYLIVDEGLEVVSNNASYRSENVLTKLKGLFSAANYIDGVEPEDKFFRVFYTNVKRENMYKGSMAGVVGQLSPIKWGNVTSNVFLGYSKHHGDFDNGEFLGGGNFALGLKNVFTKNGMKVSFSPMIGLNDLDVTDYDSDSTAKVKTNLLSEFLAVNGKIDKEIKTSEAGSLNLSVQTTLGLQRFPDYLSKFSDGDLSVDEAIEQVLSGGFEVKYNEELGKGFIIRPYVGVSVNHNLNNNIDIVKDDDNKNASPADAVTSGYYAGLTLSKEAKDINFDLDLMYGNEDGLINQIVAVSFTKSFGKAKTQTAKLEKKPDFPKVDESLTSQDYNKDLNELETLKNLNKKIKTENAALKAQNKKLKLLAQKALEENEVSKRLIVELLKENEKIKLEKQMFKNKILESENKELLEQLKGSNEGNKPPIKFLVIFATIFVLVVSGLTSLSASIYNRIILRPARA